MKNALSALIARTIAIIGITAVTSAAAMDIKISHQWRQGDGRDEATRLFVKEVTSKDPSIKFRIYPNRSLIAAPIEQLPALRDGSLEMSVYPIHYGAGQVPALSITMLPGLIRSIEHGTKLRESAFATVLQEIAESNGFRIVAWWWTPAGFVMRERELRGPSSVAGLRIRGADAYIDLILKENGASVQAMAGSEIYSAMKSGILDGLVTSAETMVSSRMFEVSRHATIGGEFNFVTLLQPLLISKQHWDKLTPAQQKIFDDAARVSEQHFHRTQRDATSDAVAAFNSAGVKVHMLTDGEYDAWVKTARERSWPAFERAAPRGAELIKLATEVK